MSFVAIAGKAILPSLLSSLFGKKDQNSDQMQFNKDNRTPIGNVTGNPQPQQAPATDPGMQQPATGQGNGFQNGMNKVSTIANILGMLKGGQQNQGPYQMQMRRR